MTIIPTVQTTEGDLPVFVFSADAEFVVAKAPAMDQIVAIHSRGRYRAAKVVKVGPKRITVAYTTQGAIDTAHEIAGIDYVAQQLANWKHGLKQAERYRAMADVIEREGIEVTEDREYPASKFVPVPAALKPFESGRNGAGTTIVNSPATLRRWADSHDSDEAKAKHEQKMAEAEREAKRPHAERVMTATHVTTKSVPREQVFFVNTDEEEAAAERSDATAGAPAHEPTDLVHVSELADGDVCLLDGGEVVAYRSPQTSGEESNAQLVCGVGTYARRLRGQRTEVAGEDGIRVERVIVTERNMAEQVVREVEVERMIESGRIRQTTVRAQGYATLTSEAHEMRALPTDEALRYIADAEERGLITVKPIPVETVAQFAGAFPSGNYAGMRGPVGQLPSIISGPWASEREAGAQLPGDAVDVIVRVP